MDALDVPRAPEERLRPGAPEGFDDFVRAHHVGLVRYALLLSGSQAQAEDLVQEVLARVYPRWEQTVHRPGSIHAYLRRAVTNEHTSWRRRWATRALVPTADMTDHDAPAPARERVVDTSPDEALWRCLRSLPPRQRAALVLRYYEGLDDEEVCAVLQCRPGTVRSLVSRGLARLRTMAEVSAAREEHRA